MLTHSENTSVAADCCWKGSLRSQATPTKNGLIIKAEVVRVTVSSLRTRQ